MKKIVLDGDSLTFKETRAAACGASATQIVIAPDALERVRAAADFVRAEAEAGKVVYGVTTGFGSRADTPVSPAQAAELQRNLLRSHATGVGERLAPEIVRAMLLIRLNTLLKGHSGARPETVHALAFFLNHGILPVVPAQGSVGASGDLCPLSHLALPLLGEGLVDLETEKGVERDFPAKDLGKRFPEWRPVELSYKEGLALNNGTTLMAALGVLAVDRAERLLRLALLATAAAAESLCARRAPFCLPRLHELRRHDGQTRAAASIARLIGDSEWTDLKAADVLTALPEELKNELPAFWRDAAAQLAKGAPVRLPEATTPDPRWNRLLRLAARKVSPQDSYSIRCAPQILGAASATVEFVRETVAAELNAAVDNPLLFPDETESSRQVVSGGNFHGQPLAMVLDHLKLAVATIGNLLERQVAKLHDHRHNDGLPAFLTEGAGLQSGLMLAQYTAAALASENKTLAHPASADTIPTCENQEDMVSMGPIAGRQALQMLDNADNIAAVALLTNYQAGKLRAAQFDRAGIAKQPGAAMRAFCERMDVMAEQLIKEEYVHLHPADEAPGAVEELGAKDRPLYLDLAAIAAALDDLDALARKHLGALAE